MPLFPRPTFSRRRSAYFHSGAEVVESRCLLSAASADVLTYHNDNARTGQDLNETILTPANVNASTFGKRFTDPVDGFVYAQPLYVANVAIPGKGVHNVVYVATENDSVYAFDADAPGAPLWHDSFINPAAGITTVPTTADWQLDLYPQIGITSTPVIDPSTGTIYVVAETQVASAAGVHDVLSLHALDIATGAEKLGGPVPIAATVRGRGAGHGRGSLLSFNADIEIQRPALLLENGVVYAAFSSLGDHGPYHGWVLGYGASTLRQVAVFNDTANGNEGGIWMSGDGLAADASGSIYALTGNGTFNPAQGGYGNTALKLTPSLRVADYFAAKNQAKLNRLDLDLGSGGVLVVPDQPSANPHLLIGGGKEGTIYVINRDKMAHSAKNAAQTVANANHSIFSTAAYFNGMVYMNAVNDVLKAYALVNGTLVGPVAQSTTTFGYPGATPNISANGTSGGIVWDLEHIGTHQVTGEAVLHAYNASNVAQELYNSNQAGTRDQPGLAVKFAVPTVANGKVFVGSQTGLSVYGLLK